MVELIARRDKSLEQSLAECLCDTEALAGGLHLRTKLVVNVVELLKAEYRHLDRDVVADGVQTALVAHVLELCAEDYLGRDVDHVNARYLADVRHGSGGTRVDLDNEYLVVINDVLDIYQTYNVQRLSELLSVVDDDPLDVLSEGLRGVD